jgi:hypothetical protein
MLQSKPSLLRTTGLIAILLALVPVSLLAQGTADKPLLRGVIVDENTRAPVSTAAIQLLDAEGKRVLATLADAQGRFQIAVPAPGNYKVRVDRLGYFPRESPAFSITVPTLQVEFQLSPHPVVLDSIFVHAKAEGRKLGPTEQLIHGRLLDDDTRAPIPAGTIELLNAAGKKVGSAITDSYGLFRLVTPTPGTYRLRAERIGYKPAEGPDVKMILRDTIRLEFFLSTQAVLMAPILVTGSSREWKDRYGEAQLDELFSRMKRFGATKNANYVMRDSLAGYEKKHFTTAQIIAYEAFRTPIGCNGGTSTYVNGAPYLSPGGDLDDYFQPGALQAIEIYTAPQIPAELSMPLFQGGGTYGMPCRVIVLWTRR